MLIVCVQGNYASTSLRKEKCCDFRKRSHRAFFAGLLELWIESDPFLSAELIFCVERGRFYPYGLFFRFVSGHTWFNYLNIGINLI
jgi:hypothetical protein